MATPQDRNGGDIIAVFISFDDDRELSRGFHLMILPPVSRRDAACRVLVVAEMCVGGKLQTVAFP
jgi:hypothetical protein